MEKKAALMYYSLFITLLITLTSCATMTDKDLKPEDAEISEVIEVPSVDKNTLFIRANSWAVDTFVSAESVIEFSDKEGGIIKGKYVMEYAEGVYTYDLRSTLTINVKDGAAKITITDPYFKVTSGLGERYYDTSYRPMQSLQSFNTNCLPQYKILISSFKDEIKKSESKF